MISVQEFLLRVRVDRGSLEAWISAGWLIPPQTDGEFTFSEVDLARAQLIRDLREDIGVNDEGISVVLHLLDQMHGLRRSMQELLDTMRGGARRRTVARSPRRTRARR
jgi:chaperone modulatory protein CbpM